MPKVTILIDGGYLRKAASPVYRYNPDFIQRIALSIIHDEQLFRILYYDCDPYTGTVRLPGLETGEHLTVAGWIF